MLKITLLMILTVMPAVAPASAQTRMLSAAELIASLRAGGHVIVMRHASSPREAPDEALANADNTPPERQLDEKGRSTAAGMGDALRRLQIPVGEVLTSPAYRARETATRARLPNPRPMEELGDGGQSMQGASRAQIAWLQKKVRELPRGSNTILVTHSPNIAGAFPEFASIADGEALVFGPDGKGGARVVARISIEEWRALGKSG